MTTVHVYLVGEGTDVWRPVPAESVSPSTYRLDPVALIPDGEDWQFPPGAHVECELRTSPSGPFLAAVRPTP